MNQNDEPYFQEVGVQVTFHVHNDFRSTSCQLRALRHVDFNKRC